MDYWAERDNGTVAMVRRVVVELGVAETRTLLQEVPRASKTHIMDALLTALGQTFMLWTGTRTLLVRVVGHGRETIFEDVDLSRTAIAFRTNVLVHFHILHLTAFVYFDIIIG